MKLCVHWNNGHQVVASEPIDVDSVFTEKDERFKFDKICQNIRVMGIGATRVDGTQYWISPLSIVYVETVTAYQR